MPTPSLDKDLAMAAVHSGAADARVVGRIRLVLAVSALLTIFIDPFDPSEMNAMAPLVLSCYVVASMVMCVCSEWGLPLAMGKSMHWFDVGCFLAIVIFSGGVNSFLFLFFFFSILVSSLRWGFDEGARVTSASVVLFSACAIATIPDFSLPRLLLRAAFLLALGYLIAQLGERKIQLKRRLALLRALSQLSNPRLGIDRAMTAVLERTRAFFAADRCIILLQEHETGRYSIRTVRTDGPLSVPAETVNAQLAQAWQPLSRTHIAFYCCPWRRWPRLAGTSLSYEGEPGHWIKQDRHQFEHLADWLDACCFISAPLVLARGKGRIYVTARARHLGRGDALFLAHIAAQGLPFIDSIDLLDRMASDAASLERKKISIDLHDTAIQPYIGLKLGLAALCNKADRANPIRDDLAKLLAMTDEVIGQLRNYAGSVRDKPTSEEPICLSALRQQTAQVMESHGVDMTVHIEGPIGFGDRLTAEVLQIVREGVSNICRHTAARRGAVHLRCGEDSLLIEIDNENGGKQPPDFLPRSISERALALGGSAYVRHDTVGTTAVCVEIPV